ncbi:MAG: hypothetical protein A3G75_07755 [Verrucomicrobia bacterium RIFCSPLOWO2_12_FULL_64_8]|nr:MAG: hypothetical protein A3G75_07755 [Verrucomicrobia bacterium RIFCSPLOWO2_12_FULL_64_8]
MDKTGNEICTEDLDLVKTVNPATVVDQFTQPAKPPAGLFFKLTDGKRKALSRSNNILPICEKNRWHTLRAEFSGDKIDVFINGRKVASAADTAITVAGAAGVCTKFDAATLYDNLS